MKFRIVRDSFAGYEVQAKKWWWPFWYQCGGRFNSTNTHKTIEQARAFAFNYAGDEVERFEIPGKQHKGVQP